MINTQNSEELNDNRKKHACSVICPSIEYLEKSEIITNVKCTVPKCDEIFSHKSALNFHLEKVHKIFQKVEKDELLCTRAMSKSQKVKENCECKYHCPKIGCKYNNGSRSLPTFHSLKNHFIRMHGNKSFKCSKCMKEFSIKSEMERHELNCGQSFVCNQCNIIYSSLAALHKHIKKKNHTQTDNSCIEKANKVQISKNSSPMYNKASIQPVYILPNNFLSSQLILIPNNQTSTMSTSENTRTHEAGSQTMDQTNQSCGIQFDASIDLIQDIDDYGPKTSQAKNQIRDKNCEFNPNPSDYDYLDAATSTSPFIDFELFFNNSSTQTQPGYFTNTCSIQTSSLEENQSDYFCSDLENVPDYIYCSNENNRLLNKTCQTNRCDTPINHIDSAYATVTQTENDYFYDYQIQSLSNSNTQSIQTQTYCQDSTFASSSNVVQTQTDFCFN